MTKKEKSSAVLGIILFAIAAVFSVSLIFGLFDFGTNSNNLFYKLGKMLIEAYGFCSVLIPAYFLTAGIFCFSARWTLQKATGLLISIVPFFTLVIAERTSRKIAATDSSSLAFMKISLFVVIAIILAFGEYLISFVIASKIYSSTHGKNLSGKLKSKLRKEKAEETQISEEELNISTPVISEDEISISDETEIEVENSVAEENVSDSEADEEFSQPVLSPYKDIWSLDDSGNSKNEAAEEDVKESESEKVSKEKTDSINYSADPWGVISTPKAPENIELVDLSDIMSSEETKETSDKKEISEEENAAEEFAEEKSEITTEPVDELDDIIASFEKDSIGFNKENKAEEKEEPSYDIDFDEDTSDPSDTEDFSNKFVFADDEPSETENAYEDISNEFAEETNIEDTDVTDNADISETGSYEEDMISEPEFAEEDSEEIVEEENNQEPDFDEDSVYYTEQDTEEEFQNLPDFTTDEYSSDDEVLDNAINVAVAYDNAIEKNNARHEEDKTIDTGDIELSLDNLFSKMDADAKAKVEEKSKPAIDFSKTAVTTDANGNTKPIPVTPKKRRGAYKISTELLTKYDADPYWEIDEETKAAGENLVETLKEFNIEAQVTEIRKGPVVTMFEILPAPGVNLNKIRSLQDNIALRLAAKSVRIVAPIPGKRAVGIEIPNKSRAVVSFRECIEEKNNDWTKMQIPVVLGKDIEGASQLMDIARTPHLLIAGATGAGKSVCVNSMILSILYKRSPADVKMILIDPKIVELSLYNGIGHLLTPVITEPKAAMQALNYCICEMERRYAVLKGLGCREIVGYNQKIKDQNICSEKLPYIVVVIDEFADLMATTGKQMEAAIARLAAKSRAVGIHLVLATQRPSVDVITGLIKANIPSRIAFMVTSRTDSNIIIDKTGAEKLLGKGDMLYSSATDPFPIRIQGTLVSDQEVENVVDAVKDCWGEPDYIDDEIFIDDDDNDDSGQMSLFNDGADDPLYEKALDIVVQAGKASASYIQRKLSIGYNRAARLVELMEERGIVGPANGSKPREIIHMP